VTTRPLMSINHLRLELVRMLPDDQSQCIELRLMDASGTAMMSFKLPGEIARTFTADEEEWQITMSPSGLLEVYDSRDLPQRRFRIELDELIKQSLSPDMLESEPDKLIQLTELKRKLTESLDAVDQTISNLAM
jgi:hypothetical protein